MNKFETKTFISLFTYFQYLRLMLNELNIWKYGIARRGLRTRGRFWPYQVLHVARFLVANKIESSFIKILSYMGSTNRISLLEIESNECGNDLEPKRKYVLKHAHLCSIIWSTSLSNWFKYRVLTKMHVQFKI